VAFLLIREDVLGRRLRLGARPGGGCLAEKVWRETAGGAMWRRQLDDEVANTARRRKTPERSSKLTAGSFGVGKLCQLWNNRVEIFVVERPSHAHSKR
jgi:hypothetical protein